MQHLGLILMLAAALFAVRISGFYLAKAIVSPGWVRFLRYTPYGALAALVVSGLASQQTHLIAALFATTITVLTLRLSRQMWAGIIAGMASFWVLAQLI